MILHCDKPSIIIHWIDLINNNWQVDILQVDILIAPEAVNAPLTFPHEPALVVVEQVHRHLLVAGLRDLPHVLEGAVFHHVGQLLLRQLFAQERGDPLHRSLQVLDTQTIRTEKHRMVSMDSTWQEVCRLKRRDASTWIISSYVMNSMFMSSLCENQVFTWSNQLPPNTAKNKAQHRSDRCYSLAEHFSHSEDVCSHRLLSWTSRRSRQSPSGSPTCWRACGSGSRTPGRLWGFLPRRSPADVKAKGISVVHAAPHLN